MTELPEFFVRFRSIRRRTLGLVSDLTQEQADFSPSSRRWSPGEILDHLVRTDAVFRGEYAELLKRWKKRRRPVSLFRTFSDLDIDIPGVPDSMRVFLDVPSAVAGIFVPRPVRQAVFRSRAVPARAPKRIEPRRGRPIDDLRRELGEYIDHLESYFADNPSAEWRRLSYYNPLCGFTDLHGMTSFVGSHEKRHQEQLREVLEDEEFPAAA